MLGEYHTTLRYDVSEAERWFRALHRAFVDMGKAFRQFQVTTEPIVLDLRRAEARATLMRQTEGVRRRQARKQNRRRN